MDFSKLHDKPSKTSLLKKASEKEKNKFKKQPSKTPTENRVITREMKNLREYPKKKESHKRTGVSFTRENYRSIKLLEEAISFNRSKEEHQGNLSSLNVVQSSSIINSLLECFILTLKDHLGENWVDEIPENIISEDDFKEWLSGFFLYKK